MAQIGRREICPRASGRGCGGTGHPRGWTQSGLQWLLVTAALSPLQELRPPDAPRLPPLQARTTRGRAVPPGERHPFRTVLSLAVPHRERFRGSDAGCVREDNLPRLVDGDGTLHLSVLELLTTAISRALQAERDMARSLHVLVSKVLRDQATPRSTDSELVVLTMYYIHAARVARMYLLAYSGYYSQTIMSWLVSQVPTQNTSHNIMDTNNMDDNNEYN